MLLFKYWIREILLVSPWVFDRFKVIARRLLGEHEEIRFLKSLGTLSQGSSVIQIGANDGIRNDPIRGLILEMRMSAVLIEPDPAAFSELQRTYQPYIAKVPITLLNCAVFPESGENCSFYTLSSKARRLLDKKEQIKLSRKASCNKERFESYLNKAGYKEFSHLVEKLAIEGIGINDLLAKWGVPDILMIDAEGMDWDLVGKLDLDRFQPSTILFEFGNPAAEKRFKVLEKLSSKGYQVETFPHNIIAYQK